MLVTARYLASSEERSRAEAGVATEAGVLAGVPGSDMEELADIRPRLTASMRPVGVSSLDWVACSPDPGDGRGVEIGGRGWGLAEPSPERLHLHSI